MSPAAYRPGKDGQAFMKQAIRVSVLRQGTLKLQQKLRQQLPLLQLWGGYMLRLAAATLAGAAVLPGQLAPFGLALCIAAPAQTMVFACAGCALGSFLVLPAALAVRQAAAVFTILALRMLLGRRAYPWAGLAGVVVCSLISQAASTLGAAQAGMTSWLVQGCLVLALAVFYREVRLQTLLARTPREQLVLLAVWTSVACCAAGWQLLALPWLIPLLQLVTLTLGSLDRQERLPLFWAGGVLACLAVQGNCAALMVGVAAAWGASRLGVQRKKAAGLFFVLGFLMLFTAQDLPEVLRLGAVNGITALVFFLLPEKLFFRLEDFFARGEAQSRRSPAQALNALASGLEAVGNGVEVVGRTAGTAGEDPNAPVETVCRQVCSACTQKARCWGSEYDTTQDSMRSFLQQWRESCTAEFPSYFVCTRLSTVRSALLKAENLRVLRRAGQAENGVLRRAVSDQYRAVADGLYRLAQNWQPETPQPQLESKVAALLNALQMPVRRLEAVRKPDGAIEVRLALRPVRLGPGGLEGLTTEISRLCTVPMIALPVQEHDGLQEMRFVCRPAYTAQVGIASRALQGGVCGDVVEALQQGTMQHVLLCDGMGTGRTAAMDAKMAALFTARLLRAGLDGDVAARMVNAALLTRETGDRGSTMDVLTFQGMDGTASLYKAGGCASYLRSSGGIKKIVAGGLPLGSAETVRDEKSDLVFAAGDWLVLATDGALAFGDLAIVNTLRGLKDCDAQQAAALLLAACLEGHTPEDDCTVAVVRILKAAGESPT